MGMKPPEEIKKALECCSQRDKCTVCPYYGEDWCSSRKNGAALALIQQLEAENAELKRERDAAVKDISLNSRCAACKKYFKNGGKCSGAVFCIPLEFEWRGPCEENGGQKEEE